MNIKQMKTMLITTHLSALKIGERPNAYHIESGPGWGKSEAAEQAAASLCLALRKPVGFSVFMLAAVTSADVKGFMIPSKRPDGGYDSVFTRAPWYPVHGNTIVFEPNASYDPQDPATGDAVTRYDIGQWPADRAIPETGVLFLDEFSQASDDVKKPAAELINRGLVGQTVLPTGWRVLSAGNRMSDRSGVKREMMFIVNRRGHISIDADPDGWVQWASARKPSVRPHFLTISFAAKNTNVVWKEKVPDQTEPYCTPRSLVKMDAELRALRTDDEAARGVIPQSDEAKEIAASWLGTDAAQFFTHLRFGEQLPDIHDIENDPGKAKLPDGFDGQMVAAHMLSQCVTKDNAGQVLAYMQRLRPEMQILTVRSIHSQGNRAAAITSHQSFGLWAVKNADLIRASRS